jgi:hypothetical protein
MERHTLVQLVGLVGFLVTSMVAFVLGGSLSEGYPVGLLFGFAIGLSIAVVQYGIVVEIHAESGGYPTKIARKIDDAFETGKN